MKRNPLIIILSGKAGNGKNLAAKLINDYYHKIERKTVNLAYSFWIKEYAKNILDWDGNETTKPRTFLQEIGVDLIKNTIDDKMFVKRMIEDIKIYSYYFDIITISDARFIEEIDEIKNNFQSVVAIHIHGEKFNQLSILEKEHISENALDNYQKFDYEIDNIGTIDALKEKLYVILEEVNKDE